MRMRFAISGAPAKSEGTVQASPAANAVTDIAKPPETKQPAAETKEAAEMTNESTKIEASTGI
jgi:two-component system nitrogen regulation sensor histidine kinase NtrY